MNGAPSLVSEVDGTHDKEYLPVPEYVWARTGNRDLVSTVTFLDEFNPNREIAEYRGLFGNLNRLALDDIPTEFHCSNKF